MQKKLSHNGNISITHEEIATLPLRSFQGKVILLTDPEALPHAFREIQKHEVVGFDTETRPSFRRGEFHKVSLLQLAVPDKVFLVRLNHTGLTPDVIQFLEDMSTRKAGVGVRDDVNALHKLQRFKAAGFEELSAMARQAGLEVESVKKLTALLLGFRISKGAQTSNWEAESLTEKQIEYAATDAWVCLEIYRKLSEFKS
jgi:ribonuclease D